MADEAPTTAPAVPAPPRPVPLPSWRDRLELLAAGEPLTPHRVVGGLLGAAALVTAGWVLLREPAPPPEEHLPRAVVGTPAGADAPEEVVAHAAGAVAAPGLYRLRPGARVADLLDAAGGPTPEADLDRVNLAATVSDGQQVHVPRRGEPSPSTGTGVASGPLDLNRATEAELDELPGIGPATAKAIVEARARRGRFRSVEDLLDVRGIGPAKLEQLRGLVRV